MVWTGGARPWARPGGPFSPGWYKQPELNDPLSIPVGRPGTKGRAFKPLVPVEKLGPERVFQPELLPSPALVCTPGNNCVGPQTLSRIYYYGPHIPCLVFTITVHKPCLSSLLFFVGSHHSMSFW